MKDDLISRGKLRGKLAYTDFKDISDWQKINEIIDGMPDGQKHGDWLESLSKCTKEYYCSECGYVVQQKLLFDYCPFCGAKMDEVTE